MNAYALPLKTLYPSREQVAQYLTSKRTKRLGAVLGTIAGGEICLAS